ncbi:polysaccharide deacetylase family protein [Hamadaea sp. NPDC051192]|uniref:polysaccharide deacetylase family protein n=1 Tax=Hamadaea sp. NPDC051192 TaxID=3154940 RepID=UPI003449AEF3
MSPRRNRPMSHTGLRLSIAASVALLTAVVAACSSGPSKQPTFAPPPTSAPAGDEPTLDPTLEASPSPSDSPSGKPSSSPTKRPSPTPSTVKDLAWYTSRLPKFGPLPPPASVNVDAGTSSPLWFKVPTTQKVAFLTIDDGATRHPMALQLLKASGVRITLFLTLQYVEGHTDYFKALQASGAVIENHTITHTSLKGKTYAFQHHEICDAADRLGKLFGRRPTLFRPPYGNYDDTTLKVARECGQKVVFYWTETVDKGKVRYQTSNHTIQPGHIVLMHFRPAYPDDFLAVLTKMKQSGVQPALLEQYVQGSCAGACDG